MSALGEYIHYTAKGYQNEGITRDGEFTSWVSQRAAIKNRAAAHKSSLTIEEIKELESVIGGLKDMNLESSMIAKGRYGVEDILNRSFNESTRNIRWDALGMEWEENEKENILGKIHRHYNEQKVLELDYQKAYDKASKLYQIMFQKRFDGSYPKGQVTNDCKELIKIIRALKLKIDKNLEKRGFNYSDNKISQKTDYQLVRDINKMIEQYAAYPALNAQQGLAFEAAIAMAPYVAQGMAYEEAAKQIVGDKKEFVKINSNRFSQSIKSYLSPDVFCETNASQGKVDVELKWHSKTAKISAKNVNLSNNRWVHIVSGSSLLFLLQDININFVNHFLNLIVEHDDAEKDKGLGSFIENKKELIMQEVILILFYKALTGDNYGRSSANIFAINDNSNKYGVRVFNMDNIIQKVVNNKGMTSLISIKNNENQKLNMVKLQNKWINNDLDGSQRIANILMQLHQQKIFVQFNAVDMLMKS